MDELISPVAFSEKGLRTIKKYRLDTELLDMKRGRWLNGIMNEALSILKKMVEEGRKVATEEERNRMLRYMAPNQPYSLMSEVYIKKKFGKLIAG